MKFCKPQTSIDDHINRLMSRGMVFDDIDQAKHYLVHIGYYRLTSYWLPYETDHATHQLMAGTRFESVLGQYNFDRELRLLVMDAIERIEISVKANWVFEFVGQYSPHSHLNADLFRDKRGNSNRVIWAHQKGLVSLQKELQRSREKWVHHFNKKYDEVTPPLWACVELMTLGSFSKWYSQTKNSNVRNRVARSYGLDEIILTSFLHHIAIVRNTCAHHARLWNRSFTFTFKLPRKPVLLAESFSAEDDRKLYNTLAVLAYFVRKIEPETQWPQKLQCLLTKYSIDVAQMGFPDDFEHLPMWKNI